MFKKKILEAAAAIALVLLTGCAVKTPPPEIKYIPQIEYKTVVLAPPTPLYTSRERVKPPPVKEYLDANWKEKEEFLFAYVGKLNILVQSLMIDRISLAAWVKEQNKIYEKKEQP